MRKVLFGTTNLNKVKEASEILGVDVGSVNFEIDEVQSLDPVIVATKKSRAYFEKTKRAVFVEDVSLSFDQLNGLPGTYINDFAKAIGNQGLIKCIGKNGARGAEAKVTIVYKDKAIEKIFVGRVKGIIAKKEKGSNGFGWDSIFIPEGSKKTFAQMSLTEKNKYSMRAIAFKKFHNWLKKK
ncbi:hypothetical protein A2382_03830 [Candidatus Woesebacteria bacterium RIFOXYB1_FULL_38_16]|uniref:Non-canonical purine NTP pyrophosphatase, RdgB/HAM1 family n=1 Tax=Candidatus Woesebacteria bacterium RIFOXYB1_FULL_38_16 TaxID=1802538 RepID=A0A1F8CSP8_9BACT|nr:MAG: hypothetical protein A2191_00720 [Candidatus Woesebacteria bacterium RIFOXYA1_FULL_38_9]OGM79096.1 MAG: hypothetical protein A2382_03830 [Candidatus Woesebacteria bacterium RIFOXYB1_FULL_38_16]